MRQGCYARRIEHAQLTPMTLYRIKYLTYRVSADSSASARRKVEDLMKKAGKDFFRVEEDASQLPLWKRLLLGR